VEVKAKVKEVLVRLLRVKPEELKDDVALQDGIGVDSTEMVEIAIALEKTFNIKLDSKEITKSSTLNDMEKIIHSKITSK